MFRISHVSDLHLFDLNDDWDRALEQIKASVEVDHADHIAITGDVVDSAQLTVIFRDFYTQLRYWGLTEPERMTIVPGNHDLFPLAHPIALLQKLFAPGADPYPFQTPTENWEEYCEIVAPRGKRKKRERELALRLLPDEPYPLGKRLSEHVALVALDSTRNGQYNPLLWASGELPPDHVNAAAEFFEENADAVHRVIVMHHYPWREDAGTGPIRWDMADPPPEEAVQQLKDAGMTLCLCGHLHDNAQVDLGDGVIACQTSGVGAYALVDLHDNGRVRITRKEVNT